MTVQQENIKIIIFSIIILCIPAYVFWTQKTELSQIPREPKIEIVNQENKLALENDITLGENTVLGTDEYFVFANQEAVVIPEPKIISMCGIYPCYTDDEFLALYNLFEKGTGLSILNKYIYQDTLADTYIKKFAEERGYAQRPFAEPKDIISFEGYFTRVEVKKAYTAMRDEMLEENIKLHFVSGYRDSTMQRAIFKEKMGPIVVSDIAKGTYNEQLNKVLSVSALPGYSKHHSGFAVDFGCGSNYLVYNFSETPCFDWLSENNFENAKRFGFIPSYPEDAPSQGPNPEPWEFVWVGEDMIKNKAL